MVKYKVKGDEKPQSVNSFVEKYVSSKGEAIYIKVPTDEEMYKG